MKSGKVAVLSFALLASACMTDPYHNQILASRSSSVLVQGWALSANTDVFAQCRPFLSGGPWTAIRTFTSAATPISVSGENVYPVTGSMVIPTTCWEEWHSQASAELRFYQNLTSGTATYQMYDDAGRRCVIAGIAAGKTASTAGRDPNCHGLSSIYVHAP